MTPLQARPLEHGEDWEPTATGLLLPPRERRRYEHPVGVDLFCGAGGFSLGVHQAGFHVAGAAEAWATAAITYLTNLGSPGVQIHFLDGQEGEEDFARSLRKCWGLKVPRKGKGAVPLSLSQEDLDQLGDAIAEGGSEVRLPPAFAGSGWLSTRRDHELGECAHHMVAGEEGYEDCDEEEIAERRREFCEAYHSEPVHREGCEHFWFGDVRKLTGQRILDDLDLEPGELDFVFGGPPCQGFSHSGKRQVMDPRNSLVFEFTRIIRETAPRAICMENVPGIASMVTEEGMPVIDALALDLERGGWGTLQATKRALEASSGLGAAIPASKRPPKGARDDEGEGEDVEPDPQLDLLAAE